jgi:hypothetical protein
MQEKVHTKDYEGTFPFQGEDRSIALSLHSCLMIHDQDGKAPHKKSSKTVALLVQSQTQMESQSLIYILLLQTKIAYLRKSAKIYTHESEKFISLLRNEDKSDDNHHHYNHLTNICCWIKISITHCT